MPKAARSAKESKLSPKSLHAPTARATRPSMPSQKTARPTNRGIYKKRLGTPGSAARTMPTKPATSEVVVKRLGSQINLFLVVCTAFLDDASVVGTNSDDDCLCPVTWMF